MSYRVDSQISGTYDTLLRRKSYILGSSKRREGQFYTTSPLVTISLNCMTLQTSKTSPVKKQFRYEVPVGHNFGGCDECVEVKQKVLMEFEAEELKRYLDALFSLCRHVGDLGELELLLGRIGVTLSVEAPELIAH